MFRLFTAGILSLIISISGFSQTEDLHDTDPHTSSGHYNRFALFTGTSLVPTHLEDGNDKVLYVPTYGLNYERIINSWFAIGMDNEIELQNYVIENEDGEVINRSFIYVASVLFFFQPIKNVILFAGPGVELTSDHNFGIVKVGMLYPIKLTREWDFAPEIAFDQVSDLYTTFTFGVSIGKKF